MAEALFDFDEARRFIEEGARAFFTRLREKFADEVFYVYVVYSTDDDAKLATCAANSERGYEETLAKYRVDQARIEAMEESGWPFNADFRGGETD